MEQKQQHEERKDRALGRVITAVGLGVCVGKLSGNTALGWLTFFGACLVFELATIAFIDSRHGLKMKAKLAYYQTTVARLLGKKKKQKHCTDEEEEEIGGYGSDV